MRIFNKNISFDDSYWMYRAKNLYECDKINNKKEYELYYETFFEDGLDTKEYNITSYCIQHANVYIYADQVNCYTPNFLVGNNILVHTELVQIINNINSSEFKNKNNFNEKIKYIESLLCIKNDTEYIILKRNDIICHENVDEGRRNFCYIGLTFNNILIKKEKNKYTYTLSVSTNDSYITRI